MNRARFFMLAIIMIGTNVMYAQEWIMRSEDGLDYNCEVIRMIMEEDYADEPFQRDGDNVSTLLEAFGIVGCFEDLTAETQPTTTDFKVTVKSNVNLREGPGTSFRLAGQVSPGDVLEVVAEDGDWYEIKRGRETAFVAGWLTTRLPDVLLTTGEAHNIEEANCIVVPDSSRSSDMDISFVITGDRKGDVVADLYAPTQDTALRVDRQLDKTFIDTGETYIYQVYRWNQWFPHGIYTIEITIDDEDYTMAWNVSERADYNIYVVCE